MEVRCIAKRKAVNECEGRQIPLRKEAPRLLLNVASTPPISGGEWRTFILICITRSCTQVLEAMKQIIPALNLQDRGI
jgi:hypothetical protein